MANLYPPDTVPSNNDHKAWKDYLKAQGIKQADVDNLLGGGVNGRTRRQIAEEVSAKQKAKKKG